MKDGEKEKFKQITRVMLRESQSDKERERIKNFRRYILNNWEAITIYGEEECEGRCTEGHVSHVLSS
ncbi:MAG: ISLre2 family transposase, partial [Clostridiaceae bacterium]|nr:ISLre2 family transposase [Clostridiaceae bacterium]